MYVPTESFICCSLPHHPVYHIFKTSGHSAQYLVEDTAQAIAILSRQLRSKPGPCSIAITSQLTQDLLCLSIPIINHMLLLTKSLWNGKIKLLIIHVSCKFFTQGTPEKPKCEAGCESWSTNVRVRSIAYYFIEEIVQCLGRKSVKLKSNWKSG